MKRILCILLSVIIMLSAISITSVSASTSPKVVNNVISATYGDKVYYLDTTNNSICKMNKNGKAVKKIVTGDYSTTDFSIYKGRIFFNKEGALQSVSLKGKACKTYNLPSDSRFICIYDNCIYYSTGEYIKKKNLTTDLTTYVYTCDDEYPKIISNGKYLLIDESGKSYIGLKLYDIKTGNTTSLISKYINSEYFDDYYGVSKCMIKGNNLFFTVGYTQGSGHFYTGDFYKVGLNGKGLKKVVHGCGRDFYIKGKTIYLSESYDGYSLDAGCIKCSTSGKVIKKYGYKYTVKGVSKGKVFFKKSKSNNLYYGKNLGSKKVLIKGKKNTKRYTNFYEGISTQGKYVLLAYGVNKYPDAINNVGLLAKTFRFVKKKI